MKWFFPSNNGGDINGIGNGYLEHFQGTRLKSLAREICQNSLDAAIDPNEPVTVEFKSFALELEEMPDYETLKDAFVRARDFWSSQSSKKAVDFFNEGLKIFDSGVIPFVRISDFNTTGLLGTRASYKSPWTNLTKSLGVSDKSATAGGAHGIGKFAPYACSYFRTVFYSTLNTDNETAYQGISRITSFEFDDGTISQGVGYYGGTDNKPVYEQLSLDPSFKRTIGQTGTDLFVAGFKQDSDWKHDMVASVVDGFLYSIFIGTLIVKIDDIIIDSSTLPEIIADYKEFFKENADKYYALLSSVKEPIEYSVRDLGVVKLWLDIQPDMHRKVAMVRKTGMKIMDKGNFSSTIPFAGMLYIDGVRLNEHLQRVENPQHTKWLPSTHPNPAFVKGIIDELIEFVKEELDKLIGHDDTDEIDPSVGDFLPEDISDEAQGETQEETLTPKIQSVEIKVAKVVPVTSDSMTTKGESKIVDEDGDITVEEPTTGAGHNDGNSSAGGSGAGSNPGDGSGNDPAEQKKTMVNVQPLKVRTVCLNKDKGEYSIIFVPKCTANDGVLSLKLSGESLDYEAGIIDVMGIGQPGLTINKNKICNIKFVEDQPIKLKVTIDYHDYCSMEVSAYGYQS